MVKSLEERLKKLKERYQEADTRLFRIKNKTIYGLIDDDILDDLSSWVSVFLDNPTYKVKKEHVDYLENSLNMYINDLENGVYGEEDT